MVKELNEILKKLDKLQKEAKVTIEQKLDSIPDVKGVKRISNNIVIVPYSVIRTNDLSAEYYMSNIQVEHIKNQLNKSSDIRILKKKIDEYIKTKKIYVNTNFSININEEVLRVLSEIQSEFSELN